MGQWNGRHELRCRKRHDGTASQNQSNKLNARKRRRDAMGVPWIICQHALAANAIIHVELAVPNSGASVSSEELFRFVEASLTVEKDRSEIMLDMRAIGSLAHIVYHLLRGNAGVNASAAIERLRVLIAEHHDQER